MEHNEDPITPHGVGSDNPNKEKRKSWIYIGLLIALAWVFAIIAWWAASRTRVETAVEETVPVTTEQQVAKSTDSPKLATEVLVNGKDNIWDIDFLSANEMIFTERNGTVSAKVGDNIRSLVKISDVAVRGEGGLMGLAVDPDFSNNRYIYTCFNSTSGDVRVVRWKVNAGVTALEDQNAILTGMPANLSGRHSGCQLAFGPDGYLWVGSGDSAQNDFIPQSPTSLGGKILRIDRGGKAAPGNLGGDFDPRIFSYGHRNTQGLAFFDMPIKDVLGVSIEHGSYQDDELNPLKPGNFGWSPGVNYNELGVPMTDKSRFPDAVDSIWSSGEPTIAPSGAAVLKGKNWKAWEGFVVTAVLKAKHLRLFEINADLKLIKQIEMFKDEFGRLRAATLGPDGALYVSTDNGSDDKIIKISTVE